MRQFKKKNPPKLKMIFNSRPSFRAIPLNAKVIYRKAQFVKISLTEPKREHI